MEDKKYELYQEIRSKVEYNFTKAEAKEVVKMLSEDIEDMMEFEGGE